LEINQGYTTMHGQPIIKTLQNVGVFICDCSETGVKLCDLMNREHSFRETCCGVGLFYHEYRGSNLFRNVRTVFQSTRRHCNICSHYHYHHHHHLSLQPFVDFCLLSQVSPSSSVFSCLLPIFDFQIF